MFYSFAIDVLTDILARQRITANLFLLSARNIDVCFEHSANLFDIRYPHLDYNARLIINLFCFFLSHEERGKIYSEKKENRVYFFVIRAISTEITTATGQTRWNQIAGNFSWLGSCIMHRSHVALYFVRRVASYVYITPFPRRKKTTREDLARLS